MALSDFFPKIQFPSQLVSKHRPGASMDFKIKRILSALEVGDRMEKGLCLLCDELYTLEHHQLMHKKARYLVREMEDEPEYEQEGSEIKFTRLLESKGDAEALNDEGQPLNIGATTAATTTLFPSDSTPLFFDPLMSDDDDTKKPQDEDKTLADPGESLCELKQSLNVALPEQNNNHLNPKGDSVAIPVPDVVDEQMVRVSRPIPFLVRIGIPCFDLIFLVSDLPCLGKEKFLLHSFNTIHVPPPSIYISFNRFRSFDPGGQITFMFPPSTASPSSACSSSSVQSRTTPATVDFPAMEPSPGPASGWPWVPRFIRIQNKLSIPHEMRDSEWRRGQDSVNVVTELCLLTDLGLLMGWAFLSLNVMCQADNKVLGAASAAVLDRSTVFIDAHVRGTMLGLVNGDIGTKFTGQFGALFADLAVDTTTTIGFDIGQNLREADHAKVCAFFRNPKQFQETYAAAVINHHQYTWYVELSMHSALDLLTDWVFKYGGLVPCIWSTLEHSKYQDFISQLANDDLKSNHYNYKGTVSVTNSPICSEHLICPFPKGIGSLGITGHIMVCTKVTKNNAMLNPSNLRNCLLVVVHYWRARFNSSLTSKLLVKYILLLVDVGTVPSEVAVNWQFYYSMKVYKVCMGQFRHASMFFMELGKNYHEAIQDTTKKMNVESVKFICKDYKTMKLVLEFKVVNLLGNSEDEVDRDGHEGNLCGMAGTLHCCDECFATYHSRCISVVKLYIPEEAWYYPEGKLNVMRPTIAWETSPKGNELFGKYFYGQDDSKLNELISTDGQGYFTSYAGVYATFDAKELQENLLRSICVFGFEQISATQQVGNNFCQIKGALMTTSTAYLPNLEAPKVFHTHKLKLCPKDISAHIHSVPKRSLLVLQRDEIVVVLHRKMIPGGSVQTAKILLKWKALPLKHGTWKCSSLRTRMFEGAGIVTGNKYAISI